MTNFIKLVEDNDHEDETWTFWLQYDGNEEQLQRLADLITEASDAVPYDFPYELGVDEDGDLITVSEEGVDLLVEHCANRGYMAEHQKITGKFTCPATLDTDGITLYKGRVRDYFKTTS